MNFRCPVCFYDRMPYAPEDYHICPCCGTEFGNDDVEYTYSELRDNWINNGARWFFGNPPERWSAWAQLAGGSYGILMTTVSLPNTAEVWGEGILEYSVA